MTWPKRILLTGIPHNAYISWLLEKISVYHGLSLPESPYFNLNSSPKLFLLSQEKTVQADSTHSSTLFSPLGLGFNFITYWLLEWSRNPHYLHLTTEIISSEEERDPLLFFEIFIIWGVRSYWWSKALAPWFFRWSILCCRKIRRSEEREVPEPDQGNKILMFPRRWPHRSRNAILLLVLYSLKKEKKKEANQKITCLLAIEKGTKKRGENPICGDQRRVFSQRKFAYTFLCRLGVKPRRLI